MKRAACTARRGRQYQWRPAQERSIISLPLARYLLSLECRARAWAPIPMEPPRARKCASGRRRQRDAAALAAAVGRARTCWDRVGGHPPRPWLTGARDHSLLIHRSATCPLETGQVVAFSCACAPASAGARARHRYIFPFRPLAPAYCFPAYVYSSRAPGPRAIYSSNSLRVFRSFRPLAQRALPLYIYRI